MHEPRRPVSLHRVIHVMMRCAHIAAMGIVLGGCFLHLEYGPLRHAIWATVGSGIVMLAMDLVKDPGILRQGSGIFVLGKLALLGMGNLFPSHRFGWYLAATLVASFGAHMPGAWRHWTFGHGERT